MNVWNFFLHHPLRENLLLKDDLQVTNYQTKIKISENMTLGNNMAKAFQDCANIIEKY